MELRHLLAPLVAFLATLQHCQSRLAPKLLIELFAPGAFSPPQNILNTTYFDTYGPDVLYPNGMRQHFMLGQQIKLQFTTLLKPTSSGQQLRYIKMYSSSEDKCIASAQSHLYGIFDLGQGPKVTSAQANVLLPPFTPMTAKWAGKTEALLQQYMPTISKLQIDKKIDSMFNPEFEESCPVGFQDLSSSTNDVVEKKMAEIQAFIDQIDSELTAQNFSCVQTFNKPKYDKDTLWQVFNAFESDKFYTGAYSSTLQQTTIDKLRLFVSYYSAIKLDVSSSNKLYTHSLGNSISQHFLQKINILNGDPSKIDFSQKYIGYSGEQKNLFSYLFALGLTNSECLFDQIGNSMTHKYSKDNIRDQPCELYPTYASNLLAQLSIEGGIFYITTYYNGANFDICTSQSVTNDDIVSCPFNAWIDIFIEKTMDSSFNERCFADDSLTNSISFAEKQKMTEKQQGNTAGINIWFFVSFVLFVIVLAQGIIIMLRNQQKSYSSSESNWSSSRDTKSVRASFQSQKLLVDSEAHGDNEDGLGNDPLMS